MKGKEAIINFLVIVALLGYIVCSLLVIKEAFNLKDTPDGTVNAVLMNFSTALTGLVGGIVAAAFGLQAKKEVENEESKNNPVQYSNKQRALQSLGGYAAAIDSDTRKEKLGNLYAWSYVIIGLVSTILWGYLEFTDKYPTQKITTVGSTFGGMIVAIVSAYFRPTAKL